MLVNFKTVLAARRLRQVDLALSLKIPPTVLSEIINGRRKADASLRSRIASALQVDEAWLFATLTKIPPPTRADVVVSAPAILCAGAEK